MPKKNVGGDSTSRPRKRLRQPENSKDEEGGSYASDHSGVKEVKEVSSQFWLMKSEPDEFSIDDLASASNSTGFWDGVRNFQARNFIRQMHVGDLIFFYHSCKIPAIVGLAQVVNEAIPDHTALEPSHKYYDPKSDPSNPKWYGLDIKFVRKLQRPISLEELKSHRDGALSDLQLLSRPRLSVQKVSKGEWDFILDLETRPNS